MLAIPFLIPSFYITQAYLATYVKSPVETPDVKFFGTDEFLSLINHLEIRKDTFFIKKETTQFCEATGTNFFTRGKAIISINSKLYEVHKKACHWEIKRKAFHIKNNDYFTFPSLSAVSSLAAAVVSAFFLPIIPGLVVTMIVGTVSSLLFSRYVEGKADDFAIANSSEEELKARRRSIKANLAYNLQRRKESKWLIFRISPAGDNRMLFLSPSATSRLKKIEAALQNRSIGLDDDKLNKINELKPFITTPNSGRI